MCSYTLFGFYIKYRQQWNKEVGNPQLEQRIKNRAKNM